MSVTLFLCVYPPVAAWSDGRYSGANPCGTGLPDKPYPDDGISDLDQLNDSETLRLGAFNIQIFGKSKAAKPEVMEVLGKIIRTYDVVAIQEIRDKSQTALPALVDVVNANSSAPYDYVVSERLGRTSSKEQYAYIYNNQTVRMTGTPHTYPEPGDTDPFHREPYIASFRVLGGNFDATLITIHTDPDEATEEINALDDVVRYAQSTYPDERDFIVMGDLNADCSYFDEDSNSTMHGSGYYWCINNSVDTTTKPTDCTYDRIILTNPAVPDFTGDGGVFRFDLEYALNVSETTAASDHYPVYAEFWRDRDADPDHAPEVVDAVIALRIAVGSREYDPEPDVNSDGRVTSLDALMILQAAAV
jgi:endonuclease/exonuclease/phosphatase family metal-dependent hydrolase